MRQVRLAVALGAAIAMMQIPVPAGAVITGGGGARSKDCLVVLDAAVNQPPARPRHIKCVDGDPACDADGTINGVCAFDVAVCANSTFDPERCNLAGVNSIIVDHAIDDASDPKFDPELQALQQRITDDIVPPTSETDTCTVPSIITVRINGPRGKANRCGRGRKKLKITSESLVLGGEVHRDRDRMRLICLPEKETGTGCDPMTLFSSTIDRIQVQIFDQSCAVSGCHDSEASAGGLVLENGHLATVDQPPTNPSADGAGWLRVKRFVPEESFVYRKLICNNKTCTSGNGLPSPDFGVRMPHDRRRIPRYLRDILRLWIEAGAPDDDPGGGDGDPWVEGTY